MTIPNIVLCLTLQQMSQHAYVQYPCYSFSQKVTVKDRQTDAQTYRQTDRRTDMASYQQKSELLVTVISVSSSCVVVIVFLSPASRFNRIITDL